MSITINYQQDEQKTVKRSHSITKADSGILTNFKEKQKSDLPLKRLFQIQPQCKERLQKNEKIKLKTLIHKNQPKQYEQKYQNQSIQFQNSIIQPNQNQISNQVDRCCIRLFTFMESTQKQRINDHDKQNIFNGNSKVNNYTSTQIENLNNHVKSLFKTGQSAKSSLSLKQKTLQNHLQQNSNIQSLKDQENQLISFIQGSRRKRQELLIQLEKIDFDSLHDICPDRITSLTPHQASVQPLIRSPKLISQSTRHSLQNKSARQDYFRRKSLLNQPKSPRVVMKQHLKQRNFSQLNMKTQKKRRSAQKIPLFKRKPSKNESIQDKQMRKDTETNSSLVRLRALQTNKSSKAFFANQSPNPSNIKRNDQIYEIRKNSSRKSILKRQSSKKSVLADGKTKITLKAKPENQDKRKKSTGPQSKDHRDLEKLVKKKKQLEKQLFNLNDQIVLFNRKKKKDPKKSFK